jgi:hypothetical protein
MEQYWYNKLVKMFAEAEVGNLWCFTFVLALWKSPYWNFKNPRNKKKHAWPHPFSVSGGELSIKKICLGGEFWGNFFG